MTVAATTVWYTPGPWVVVAGPTAVLLLETSVEAPLFGAWADAAAAGADVDQLLAIGQAQGLAGLPSFAVVEPRADGLRVVLRGAARVWCADGQELSAAGAEPWRDGVIGAAVLPARVGGSGPVVGPRLPLTAGAAFAAAVDLYPAPPPVADPPATAADTSTWAPGPRPAPRPAEPAPAVATPVAPVVAPAAAPAVVPATAWVPPAATIDEAVTSPTTPVSEAWTEGGPPTGPPVFDPQDYTVARSSLPTSGPTVVAVRCPVGHLSPAHAQVCRVCDRPIGSNQQPTTVARPTLGLLRLPSGQTITLDRGVVFGRAPSARDTPTGELQHVVSLASPEKDISRNHLEIRLDGWHVLALDLGSVNGTVVTLPGRAPQRLRADEPVLLERGATMTLADEVTVAFEIPA